MQDCHQQQAMLLSSSTPSSTTSPQQKRTLKYKENEPPPRRDIQSSLKSSLTKAELSCHPVRSLYPSKTRPHQKREPLRSIPEPRHQQSSSVRQSLKFDTETLQRRISSVSVASSSSSSLPCSVQTRRFSEKLVDPEEDESLIRSVAPSQRDLLFFDSPTPSSHLSHVWDDPECEANAPASAWCTLGNRALLCRPLPLDVGRCVCYIRKDRHQGSQCYALYTDEGYGRLDRKLAIAVHKRRAGRSEFVVYPVGSEWKDKPDTVLGRVQANLVGSRYLIWDEVDPTTSHRSSTSPLLGVVMFQPTVATFTGSYRVMRALIPKQQSTQISMPSTHRENGLAIDWEENMMNVHQLHSRKPYYNKTNRRYELDFKDRWKKSAKILTSANNFQLTMNENGKQAILMLGKIGKEMYLMEYRYPLTAHQAFSISLSSLDSKLCCSL